MKLLKMKNSAALILIVLVLYPVLSYADQGTGSIEVNVNYTNGDRADSYGMVLKIYQDFNNIPYKEIGSLSSNPYNILSLPLGHKYKVEVYVNNMYASVGYVDLQTTQQRLDITIPLSGGLRFNVFFNDGATPLEGATVSIKSKDGKIWATQVTDDQGKTLRSWIQSTTLDSDYYIAEISKGENLVFTQSNVKLRPGIPQDVKVITPWPSVVQQLIVVNVYKTATEKVSKSDGNFLIELYNSNNAKVAQSNVDSRGQGFFSKLKVDDYLIHAIKLVGTKHEEWGSKNVTISGSQTMIDIFKNMVETQTTQASNVTTSGSKNIQSCKCVAFRLDNLQDYWLNNVQIEIIDVFQKKNASLTVGIIGKAFGEDPKITNYLKEKSQKNNPTIEIANNGWEFEDFTKLTKDQQSSLIKQSNEKISTIFGVTPLVFIPPFGKINDDTFDGIHQNGMTHLSSSQFTDPPPYALSNTTFYLFPATVFTGYSSAGNPTLHKITNEEILASIQNSLQNYGFAVILLNFQDYAVRNQTNLENNIDMQQIHELELLIDKVRDSGLTIVTIGKINEGESLKSVIPGWIKNNAGWWAQDKITESDFVKGIEYMIQKKIIVIQNLSESGKSNGQQVPLWIKNNAKWWSEGQISDDDFVLGLQYLIKIGIIHV